MTWGKLSHAWLPFQDHQLLQRSNSSASGITAHISCCMYAYLNGMLSILCMTVILTKLRVPCYPPRRQD